MDETHELRAWLTALRTPGLGPGGLRERLDAANGDIHAALRNLHRHAAVLGDGAKAWLDAPDEARLAADIAWLAEPDHHLLRCTDADFPPQLENIPQPPAALFVAGNPGLALLPQVAIVGARSASVAGMAHASAFARELAQAGFAITSGMADGIDGAAHAAALDAGASTLAVIGTPRHHREERRTHERARELLAIFGLDGLADEIATNLPYGSQRRLEIARALATEPALLLLDEPAAGMNHKETADLALLIRSLPELTGATVLLIEHEMKLVMSISDRVTVLEYGRKISEGTPDHVRNDPVVIEAYLGGSGGEVVVPGAGTAEVAS